jgi:hypothetical protein
MSGPRSRTDAATALHSSARPSRTASGERRLRALSRLAIPERLVPLARAVEPGAGTSAPLATSDLAHGA